MSTSSSTSINENNEDPAPAPSTTTTTATTSTRNRSDLAVASVTAVESDVPSSIEYKDQGLTLDEIRGRFQVTTTTTTTSTVIATTDEQRGEGEVLPSSLEYKDQYLTLDEYNNQRHVSRDPPVAPSSSSAAAVVMNRGDSIQFRSIVNAVAIGHVMDDGEDLTNVSPITMTQASPTNTSPAYYYHQHQHQRDGFVNQQYHEYPHSHGRYTVPPPPPPQHYPRTGNDVEMDSHPHPGNEGTNVSPLTSSLGPQKQRNSSINNNNGTGSCFDDAWTAKNKNYIFIGMFVLVCIIFSVVLTLALQGGGGGNGTDGDASNLIVVETNAPTSPITPTVAPTTIMPTSEPTMVPTAFDPFRPAIGWRIFTTNVQDSIYWEVNNLEFFTSATCDPSSMVQADAHEGKGMDANLAGFVDSGSYENSEYWAANYGLRGHGYWLGTPNVQGQWYLGALLHIPESVRCIIFMQDELLARSVTVQALYMPEEDGGTWFDVWTSKSFLYMGINVLYMDGQPPRPTIAATLTQAIGWRFVTHAEDTVDGWLWDVAMLQLYPNLACEVGTHINYARYNNITYVESGHVDVEGYGPENAFRPSGLWGGRPDENDLFFIGIIFDEPVAVGCVWMDQVTWTRRLRVQALLTENGAWTDVWTRDGLTIGFNQIGLA